MSAVETATGRVEGRTKDGVTQFRGIPFAAPPVGDLRFRPPQPALSWTGTRDATRFGPQALQAAGQMEALFGGTPPASSEDCLFLNVYTPAADDARRPVLVWIHGGAFLTGSGATPWYNGQSFAAAHDLVVVTINYRLGALGFLHLEDIGGDGWEGTGNLGILDQVAALEWVRDNIAAFGGDPDNVTAFGESAGAMSVGTLLGTPAAKGLFTKAIPQSGAAHHGKTREAADATARELFAELGLEPTPEGAARLRDLPVDAILEAQNTLVMRNLSAALAFTPVVDGIVLPEAPIDAIGGGSAAGVRVLIGTNADEMKLFSMMDTRLSVLDEATLLSRVGKELDDAGKAAELVTAYRATRPDASAGEIWGDLQSDYIFRIPAVRLAERQSDRNNAVFSYLFRWKSPAFGGALGACHALEIPFVWNTLEHGMSQLFCGPADDTSRALAATMHEAWATFARTGTPSAPGLPDWPAYDTERRATMIFDATCRVEDDPGAADREAWAALR
ncbi:MAG: para-nitrobenzyl esterase [Actinomycetota bacterium]|nr:para-nitrobenzyl esterase [Actinomycetota bacterium]